MDVARGAHKSQSPPGQHLLAILLPGQEVMNVIVTQDSHSAIV